MVTIIYNFFTLKQLSVTIWHYNSECSKLGKKLAKKRSALKSSIKQNEPNWWKFTEAVFYLTLLAGYSCSEFC